MFRDHTGTAYLAYSGIVPKDKILHIELRALLIGILQAPNQGFTKVDIVMDNLQAVNILNYVEAPPWRTIPLVTKIRHALLSISDYTVKHIYRECNRVADLLASLMGSDFVNLFIAPFNDVMCEYIRQDACNQVYTRRST